MHVSRENPEGGGYSSGMCANLGFTMAVMSNYDMAAETISHKVRELVLR
ncbi:MAG: hypothetical protein KKG33_07395 [candidate division Zixibacteria bacterium]|nr:hypothetical protein [candidate division Zixibacteria bacterium]MBU1469805.1 hypothetical protein [candidate division Zixibacteria bacterium]MBU2625369.1 hypothetical protein [candidate division Zixibacteria bacterium]